MKILITGANGQLGSQIIEQLRRRIPAGQIVAGVRQVEQAAHLREQGIEVRYADYDVPESLAAAVSGISRLLLISSPHQDDSVRLTQHQQVIAAAKAGGVKHLLYTGLAFSGWTAGQDAPENVHALTEQAIVASGLEYTFLRNGLYMDFVGVLGLKEAMSSGELVTAPGAWVFNSVTRGDLALASVLAEVAGRRVVHLEDAGVQHWIYAFLSRLDTSSASRDLEQLIGRPVTPLKDSILPFLV